jgi:AcrR family transcriptional regulator
MVVQSSDLTTLARIRDAALDLFADRGVRATSIRDVARVAGVSAGLVQHYYPTKAALCAGVNNHVAALATQAFAHVGLEGSKAAAWAEELGQRITQLVREHPSALRYVARSAADGDEGALQLFDGFVAIASTLQEQQVQEGLLHSDLDLVWSALNLVVLNLGTIMLERAINRHLPAPFSEPESLERWRKADTALFRRALYRDADAEAPPTRPQRRGRKGDR